MISPAVGVPLNPGVAADWVRQSLSQGTKLAGAVAVTIAGYRSAWLLAPESWATSASMPLDDNGRGIPVAAADAVSARFLAQLYDAGGQTLIVENDLARIGDPLLDENVCFVEDRVIGWTALTEDTLAATALLRCGSSGYPLNAYVSRLPALDLGLIRRHQVTEREFELVANSILAVVVSVFDAEAYVAIADSR